MATRREHYVTFQSPGSFYSEETTKPVHSHDPAAAARMAAEITERYGARPFAFVFSTRIVADDVDDGEGGKLKVEPKEVYRSGRFFLGGMILSYDEVEARGGDNQILLSNMRGTFAYVVENTNSFRSTQPFGEKDVVVDPQTGAILQRGDDVDRRAYREQFAARKFD